MCAMLSKVMFIQSSTSLGTGAQIVKKGRVSTAINESDKRMRMRRRLCSQESMLFSRLLIVETPGTASADNTLVQNVVS